VPSLRQRVARWIAGPAKAKTGQRMYAAARNTRSSTGFGSSGNSSADAEISLSLTQLRARSRQMVRDSSYAKRARTVIVDNVIGSGIGMQAQVKTSRDGELFGRVNDDIERVWREWACAEHSHTGGVLHFNDLERAAMGQVVDAGEAFIRIHRRAFGGSAVPLALELVEAERLAHDIVQPGAIIENASMRMGIEVDDFNRPLAYWIRQRHPGDIRAQAGITDRYERVPAADILHIYIADRWPQTRGEPWMHTVLRKIDEMNEYTSLEVQAARGSAAYFATIETPAAESPGPNDEEEDTGAKVMDLEPMTVQELAPGEKLEFHTPNRPNDGLDQFMRAMLREVASGLGVSYESLSRDYSQSNYSSSRLSLLDDRDRWRTLQQWWIRKFRHPLHKAWLHQAVMARAIESVQVQSFALDMERFEAVLFKPRGWQWIDPAKDVAAFKEARRSAFISTSEIIRQTGGGADVEDVIAEIQREDAMFEAAGIERDTEIPDEPVAAAPAASPMKPQDDGQDDVPAARARIVRFQ
jgi:lambda family phage portal protein